DRLLQETEVRAPVGLTFDIGEEVGVLAHEIGEQQRDDPRRGRLRSRPRRVYTAIASTAARCQPPPVRPVPPPVPPPRPPPRPAPAPPAPWPVLVRFALAPVPAPKAPTAVAAGVWRFCTWTPARKPSVATSASTRASVGQWNDRRARGWWGCRSAASSSR